MFLNQFPTKINFKIFHVKTRIHTDLSWTDLLLLEDDVAIPDYGHDEEVESESDELHETDDESDTSSEISEYNN